MTISLKNSWSSYANAHNIYRQFACNGTIVQDEKAGDVIQLQGDQRNAVKDFLIDQGGLEMDPKTIKVHGF